MVSKIAEKIMSKNKFFLVLGLGVAQLLFSQLAQPSFYMFLPRQTGGDGNQQENNLEKVYRVLQQQLCQAIAEIYVELQVG
jgi:hypothetical protein